MGQQKSKFHSSYYCNIRFITYPQKSRKYSIPEATRMSYQD